MRKFQFYEFAAIFYILHDKMYEKWHLRLLTTVLNNLNNAIPKFVIQNH